MPKTTHNEDALDRLDNAVDRGFANYPYLAVHDRFFASMLP
jgi:hypothetical protein